jgi:hypothetical protein
VSRHLGGEELARAALDPAGPAPGPAEHLASCPACRAEAERLAGVLEELGRRAELAAPPVRGSFRWPRPRAVRRGRWAAGLAGAAAAAAALALWLAPAPAPEPAGPAGGPWAGPWAGLEEPAGPGRGFTDFVTAGPALAPEEGFAEFAAPVAGEGEEEEPWFLG